MGIKYFACLWLSMTLATQAGLPGAANAAEKAGFQDMVAKLEKHEGLIPLYQDQADGKAYMLLDKPDPKTGLIGKYIYVYGLTGGLGSNPVGLDRGMGGGEQILAIRQVGGKILFEAENMAYRASADRPTEKRAVENSFARSVLWSAPAAATDANGRILLDITGFLTRDAGHFAAHMAEAGQGNFRLDGDRSVLDTRASLVFPENLEFDAYLTFASDKPGPEIRSTTPAPNAVTLIEHHSFIKLPDDGYQIRYADPRTANITNDYADYSAQIQDPMVRHLARRFRLEKTDPTAALSPVKKPIVYYVDNGAPAAIRKALIEGISWWADAFEAAGFKDAFQVKELPEGAHPMDVRYNIVQWVHRETRGWSYGGGIADPRTGEMIKAMVVLGSLRVRQDRTIFEGLLGAEKSGSGAADDPVQLALARIRQLGAHEVGHTLGFHHNMAASSYMGRASVMDYPAPYIRAREDGALDSSKAYAVGAGPWDKFTVKYLYSQFAPGTDEKAALDKIIETAYGQGMIYVADQHSRPDGTAHPHGALWDNGAEPVAELRNVMQVRKIALEHFGLRNLSEGQPLSQLSEVLVPVYLYHRYQMEAAAKAVGGVTFSYKVKGDNQDVMKTLDPSYQRGALQAVLKTVDPAALDLPDALLNQLTPRVMGGDYTREMFRSKAYPVFDLLDAAGVAADMTFGQLLHPDRMGRLVEFHRRNDANPSLMEVLESIAENIFDNPRNESGRQTEIRHVVQTRYVATLIGLAQSDSVMGPVKDRLDAHLRDLEKRLSKARGKVQEAHYSRLSGQINRYLNRPAPAMQVADEAPRTPPGSPIGASTANTGWEDMCWHCRDSLNGQ